MHNGLAGSGVQKTGTEADQAARRNVCINVHANAALIHLEDFAAALTQQFKGRPHAGGIGIEADALIRLMAHAIDFTLNDFWLTNGQLKAFAAHIFQEHAQVQQTASGDSEFIRAIARRYAQCDVAAQLALKPFGDLPTGDKLAFLAHHWTVIDSEDHVQRWLVNLDARHRHLILDIHQGVANFNVRNTFNRAQISCTNFRDFAAAQAFKAIHLHDLGLLHGAVRLTDCNLLAGLQDAVVDATDGNSTNVFAVDQAGHQRLKRSINILGWSRNVLGDHAEHVMHALVADVDIAVGPSSATGCVDHWEVQCNIIGAKIHQEVKHFVNHC